MHGILTELCSGVSLYFHLVTSGWSAKNVGFDPPAYTSLGPVEPYRTTELFPHSHIVSFASSAPQKVHLSVRGSGVGVGMGAVHWQIFFSPGRDLRRGNPSPRSPRCRSCGGMTTSGRRGWPGATLSCRSCRTARRRCRSTRGGPRPRSRTIRTRGRSRSRDRRRGGRGSRPRTPPRGGRSVRGHRVFAEVREAIAAVHRRGVLARGRGRRVHARREERHRECEDAERGRARHRRGGTPLGRAGTTPGALVEN